jgi:prephenate dehydrogenase
MKIECNDTQIFKNPLVVGYKGEIGSFLLNGLLRTMPKALNIWCFDINESEEEKIDRIKKSDYIFLCVPIKDTVEWLMKYKPFLKDKIIIEQCSLKYIIHENKNINDLKYISMHLLFRPSATPDEKDRRCIVVGISKDNVEFTEQIQLMTKAQIIFLDTYTEHDKLMAEKQALIHKVLLALDKTIDEGIDTYTSSQIRKLADRIKAGNQELYDFIQTNRYLSEVLVEFKIILDHGE